MKILIIEDEEPAYKRLQKMLKELEPGHTLHDQIVSVSSAVKWFKENKAPDLIISDIQLSDGISFEIFKQVDIKCPVIFTTAYDQYAIEAFKVNSIDYLLKPVKKEELEKAVTKFKALTPATTVSAIDINKLLLSLQPHSTDYKKRFVVRYGEHIKTIDIEEVVYFYTEDKATFLCTKDARRFVVDFNLDTLDSILNPKVFFRINRQYIISIYSIAEMFAYSKSRVLIKLNPPTKHETIVSTERSADFKHWLGDEK
ncbi:MAG: response regulator transcription factor [Chitinophagaceae bacterium]|nr:response regulator transcription factor [Chitinophagaceae bacterium]MBK9484415.1 response regulator transcription factor [Chitinophagaceae bacterium]MBL0199009.1 response regulator transcription factor [Chitinophagaceae bacterium]